MLVRVVGQAPLAATVYSLERLRCNGCGQVFTAQEPEGVGPEKYDETAGAMIAQLKYGSGTPFYRLEQLEKQLGIPLPAATQWEIVEEVAEVIKPARDELIRQAAQGEVLHNDDTGMKVLKMEREPGDKRTGIFTSGIVSTTQGWKIALYFTGRQHAGENIADVLKQRRVELGPAIQMCDALSWNAPKLPGGVELLVAHCLAHGRRQIVEVAQNFPSECRHVLERLGEVYRNDAAARDAGLTPEERLRFHQEHSQPIMDALHGWLEAQFAERKTEPNSGLGQGDPLSAATLAAADAVSAGSRGTTGQQPGRKSAETSGPASQERVVLPDAERGAGGRPVHEPDPHLPALRRQLVRLPDGVAAPRPGTGGQSRGVDAVELPRDAGAGWSMMNLCLAEKDRTSAMLGVTLRNGRQTGLSRRQNPITFLARHGSRRKCFAPACTPAFPPTISRPFRCRSAPCGNMPPGAAGRSPCRSVRSAPVRPSEKLARNCWRRRAAARSTWCWCGGWTAGAGR